LDANEHDLYFDRIRFENECLLRTGTEFQSLFEGIMSKAESSFVTVRPWGSEGDRKCDGLVTATGTVFQVYAPEQIKIASTRTKMEEDCAGAVDHWDEMREWVFVWSGLNKGLPPELVTCLTDLRGRYPRLTVDDWNRDRLWSVVEKKLSKLDRATLFGPPPRIENSETATAVEIQTVLNFLATDSRGPAPEEDFDLTDLKPKLAKNHLTATTERLVGRALPLAREVERYVNGNYDSSFSKKVGARLIGHYQELTASGLSGDNAFLRLVDFASGDVGRGEAYFWGAAGIVTYYFEICDIFER
jgi:hypothetical protein